MSDSVVQVRRDGVLLFPDFRADFTVIYSPPCLCSLSLFIFCSSFSPSPVERKKMNVFTDVQYEDLERLNPGKWLNDDLVYDGLRCVFC
jgi:hypothetical protein